MITTEYERVYTGSQCKNESIIEEVENLLEGEILRSSLSPCGFLLVIHERKNEKAGFCVDIRTPKRRKNSKKWPLPNLEKLVDRAAGVKVVPSPDVFAGHWIILLTEESPEILTLWYHFE